MPELTRLGNGSSDFITANLFDIDKGQHLQEEDEMASDDKRTTCYISNTTSRTSFELHLRWQDQSNPLSKRKLSADLYEVSFQIFDYIDDSILLFKSPRKPLHLDQLIKFDTGFDGGHLTSIKDQAKIVVEIIPGHKESNSKGKGKEDHYQLALDQSKEICFFLIPWVTEGNEENFSNGVSMNTRKRRGKDGDGQTSLLNRPNVSMDRRTVSGTLSLSRSRSREINQESTTNRVVETSPDSDLEERAAASRKSNHSDSIGDLSLRGKTASTPSTSFSGDNSIGAIPPPASLPTDRQSSKDPLNPHQTFELAFRKYQESTQTQSNELELKIKVLEDLLENEKKAKEALETKVVDSEKDNLELKKKNSALEEALKVSKSKEEENSVTSKLMESLRGELEEKKGKIQTLQSEFDRREENRKEEIRKLNSTIERKEQAYKSMVAQHNQETAKRNEAQAKKKTLTSGSGSSSHSRVAGPSNSPEVNNGSNKNVGGGVGSKRPHENSNSNNRPGSSSSNPQNHKKPRPSQPSGSQRSSNSAGPSGGNGGTGKPSGAGPIVIDD